MKSHKYWSIGALITVQIAGRSYTENNRIVG